MAVRKRLYHPEEVRAKIKTSQLLNRLSAFAFGEVELSTTQVTAILGLLRKTMPDLSAMEHSGALDVRAVEELTNEELSAIAVSGSTRATEPSSSEEEPSQFH